MNAAAIDSPRRTALVFSRVLLSMVRPRSSLHEARRPVTERGLPSRSMPRSNGAMLLALALALSSGDWPQFRGPTGNGVVPAAAIPLRWSESENVAWRIDVPGHGWSQPIVL